MPVSLTRRATVWTDRGPAVPHRGLDGAKTAGDETRLKVNLR
jgi:hypothetical protein